MSGFVGGDVTFYSKIRSKHCNPAGPTRRE